MHPHFSRFAVDVQSRACNGVVRHVDDLAQLPIHIGYNVFTIEGCGWSDGVGRRRKYATFDTMGYEIAVRNGPVDGVVVFSEVFSQMWGIWWDVRV